MSPQHSYWKRGKRAFKDRSMIALGKDPPPAASLAWRRDGPAPSSRDPSRTPQWRPAVWSHCSGTPSRCARLSEPEAESSSKSRGIGSAHQSTNHLFWLLTTTITLMEPNMAPRQPTSPAKIRAPAIPSWTNFSVCSAEPSLNLSSS